MSSYQESTNKDGLFRNASETLQTIPGVTRSNVPNENSPIVGRQKFMRTQPNQSGNSDKTDFTEAYLKTTKNGYQSESQMILQRKQLAAFHFLCRQEEIKTWFEKLFNRTFTDILGELKDGILLCQLANKVIPGIIPRINKFASPFAHMENITLFLEVCQKIGMSEIDRFTTIDLYEEKDIPKVITCLICFEEIAEKMGFTPNLEHVNENSLDFSTSQMTKAIQFLRKAQEKEVAIKNSPSGNGLQLSLSNGTMQHMPSRLQNSPPLNLQTSFSTSQNTPPSPSSPHNTPPVIALSPESTKATWSPSPRLAGSRRNSLAAAIPSRFTTDGNMLTVPGNKSPKRTPTPSPRSTLTRSSSQPTLHELYKEGDKKEKLLEKTINEDQFEQDHYEYFETNHEVIWDNTSVVNSPRILDPTSNNIIVNKRDIGVQTDFIAVQTTPTHRKRRPKPSPTPNNISHIVNPFGSSTTYYETNKEDPIDVILGEFLNQTIQSDNVDSRYISTLPEPITRINYGQYLFGPLRLFVKFVNGKIVCRVGGGWIPIQNFFSRYSTINKASFWLSADNSVTPELSDSPHYMSPTVSKRYYYRSSTSPKRILPIKLMKSFSTGTSPTSHHWKHSTNISNSVRKQLFMENVHKSDGYLSTTNAKKISRKQFFDKLSTPRNPKPAIRPYVHYKTAWRP